ncbi:MAG: hypothetical protein ACFB15_22415 [Cyclobacteriaceae bacterium]
MIKSWIFSLTLFFCLAWVASFAQTRQPYSANIFGGGEAGLTDNSKFSQTDVVSGSPYLYGEFIVGTVYHDGFNKVSHLPLRFNILTNEFEVVKNGLIYTFAEPERIDRIVLKDEVFAYIAESEDHELSGFVKMWDFQLPTVVSKMRVSNMAKLTDRYLFNKSNPVSFHRMRDEHYVMQSETEIYQIRGMKRNADVAQLAAEVSSQLAK